MNVKPSIYRIAIARQYEEMEFTFRASGWGRFLVALFLIVWLAAWAAAEWFALRFLIWMMKSGGPQHAMEWLTLAFILVWVAGWSLGGILATVELLRLVAGADSLRITPDGWIIRRGVGPLARTTHVPPSEYRDVFLRPGGTLVVDSASGEVVVTGYGSLAEKREIVRRYSNRDAALNELPTGWMSVSDGGGIRLTRPSIENPGCLFIIAVLSILCVVVAIRFTHVASIAAFAFAALFAWGLFSRREWLVHRDRIAYVVRWLAWRKETIFDNGSLAVTASTDTDGDEWFTLAGTSRGKRVTLVREMNDARTVLRLARQIEKASGWSISVPHSMS